MSSIVTEWYSDLDMACPPDYYGGYKDGRIKEVGVAERLLSHIRTGEPTGATFQFTLSDKDRRFREQFASATDRYWFGDQEVFMTSRAVRAAKERAWTIWNGPVLEVQPDPEMGWRFTLGERLYQKIISSGGGRSPWRRIGDGFLSQLDEVAEGLDLDSPEPRIYGIHKRLPDDPPSGQGLVFPPIYIGKMTVGGDQYHVWVLSGHACADVPDIQVDYVSKIGDEGTHWLVPHHSGWTAEYTTPYVDLVSDTYGNLRRYSLILGKVGSADPDACAAGEKSLTVWVEGVESVGDGSGAVIVKRFLQYKHWVINDVENMGPDAYMSGPWLSNPTLDLWDGGVLAVDEDSFDACDAIAFERFPADDGYTGAAIIGANAGDVMGTDQRIAGWNRSCACSSGPTHQSRFKVTMLHPTTAIKDAAPLIDDANTIIKDSFNPSIVWSEQASLVPFNVDKNHVTGQFITAGSAVDPDAATNYNRTIEGEVRDYPAAPGITAAYHLAYNELLMVRHPPRMVEIETELESTGMLELGDYIRYRHYASIGTSKSQIRLGQIRGHQVQAGSRRVKLLVLDCEDYIDIFVPGVGEAPALNDRCATAREFVYTEPSEGNSWWQRFTQDTTPHTADAGITALVSPNSDAKPAWFKFTAPADGNLSVVTTTSAYDTVLYFLDGTCGADDWTILNSGDDEVGVNAAATVDLVSGQTVYILIIGKTAADVGFLLAQASFAPEP